MRLEPDPTPPSGPWPVARPCRPCGNPDARRRDLHPCHSRVANIAGPMGQAVPLVPVGFTPHAYPLRAEDISCIGVLDVVVLYGIGYDDFAGRMIAASEPPKVPVIEATPSEASKVRRAVCRCTRQASCA